MSSVSLLSDERSVFWQSFEDFCSSIERKRSASRHANEIVVQTRALAQTYFRAVKPELQTLITADDMAPLDLEFQALLALANSQGTVGRYKELIPRIRALRPIVEVKVELAISAKLSRT